MHRTRLKSIIKINNNNNNNNNNNSFRMFLTSSFIIHEKFQNLPDMPGACRMRMFLMKADKFLPLRENGDASLQEESGKHLSK